MSSVARRPGRRRSFGELWDELLHVPEGYVGEIVEGELVLSPRPGYAHTSATSNLGVLIGGAFGFGIGGPGGWKILDEPGIRFDDELRVPDLAGWRVDRFVPPEGQGPITIAPDWICEALSPSTARTDRSEKLPLYARHEVRHVWLIDAQIQTLEVLRLEHGRWMLVGVAGADARVRAEPFDAIELDLTQLWGPVRPPPPAEGDQPDATPPPARGA